MILASSHRFQIMLFSPVLGFPMILGAQVAGDSDQCGITGGLELREEWRYFPPEASTADRLIGWSSWVTRHAEGGIYVADELGHSILHLSLGGEFIRRIGRKGEGPGEFDSPMVVRSTENGFAVLDLAGRVSFFDTAGVVHQTVLLQPRPSSAREFVVLRNGNVAITGAVPLSDHVIHVYGPNGQYLNGLGQLRMDLDEPILQMRYSDGLIAETGDMRIAFARRVPFEFMLFEQSEVFLKITHPDVIHDYVPDVATRLEPDGWRFSWRHPLLTSFLPLHGGCFLAVVSRLPENIEGGRIPELTDYYSELVFLDDEGRVLERQTLSFDFVPTETWKDPDDPDRHHLIGIGVDRATGLAFPVQYQAQGRLDRERDADVPFNAARKPIE